MGKHLEEEAKPIFSEQSWSRFHNISHSGTYIASMLYPTGQYDIVLFDETGSYKKIITDQKYDDFYPQFSKDDLTIFYQKKLSNTKWKFFLTILTVVMNSIFQEIRQMITYQEIPLFLLTTKR